MAHRLVFCDGQYEPVTRAVYAANPGLAEASWETQNTALLASGFGCADAYAAACRYHGVDALDIIVGAGPLDRAMANDGYTWAEDAIVVLRHPSIHPAQWAAIQTKAAACVLMVSSLAPDAAFLAQFDLIVTAFAHYEAPMRAAGLDVRYLPLAFDPRRLGLDVAGDGVVDPDRSMPWAERDLPCTFVGGLGIARHWPAGQHAIAAVMEGVPDAKWWGYRGPDKLPDTLRRTWQGEAWGPDYFGILGRSRTTVNRHGTVHQRPHATGYDWMLSNLRSFEAPGMGACLLTEDAANLRDFFEPWEEVVPYANPREAAIHARQMVERPEIAERIAAAGQRRVIQSHLYVHRMPKLLEWVEAL